MGQLFHACDIGNPCIDFENYISWAALLSYEFNEQTVLEKENNVEVTEMLRYKDLTTFYKGQTGFISNFLLICRFYGVSVVEGDCGDV
jgi:cAMP-specific phosphodiesterase 4